MEIFDEVTHGYAKNGGVKLHYVTMGEGPLLIMLHGFPDFWMTWRHQIKGLSDRYRVVALDLRGYNKSDKPKGSENYTLSSLLGDVETIIHHFEEESAILAGNDWGGAISWYMGMLEPEKVERLIVCNMPHPRGLIRELANNPDQAENSRYAREFQKERAHEYLTAESLADIVSDEETREKYIEAFERSDFEAMLNYYKINYPREPYTGVGSKVTKIKCPVLVIYGLQDWALLPPTLNDTWDWIDNRLTLVTLPNAGHFVQQEEPEFVTSKMKAWLEGSD